VKITLPGMPARSYSPANLPGDNVLQFFVRVLKDGKVNPNIAEQLSTGTPILIDGPFGNACVSRHQTRPLLLAGGGTGIAPMLSIARHMAANHPKVPCWFYQGFKESEDTLAEKELAEIVAKMPNFRCEVIYSEQAPSGGRSGFLDAAILADHSTLEDFDVYIAGPPPMIDAVDQAVRTLGAHSARIKTDPFLPSIDTAPQRDTEPKVGPFSRLFKRFA
jgi:NAD(P)H-flavin reductase